MAAVHGPPHLQGVKCKLRIYEDGRGVLTVGRYDFPISAEAMIWVAGWDRDSHEVTFTVGAPSEQTDVPQVESQKERLIEHRALDPDPHP